MNLDELQSARDRERQTDKLQQLRESFYADAGQFVTQLRAERDRAAERADDPWNSPEATRLNDEIDTATQLVEDIYERRIGKLVKAASLDAADLATNVEGMTAEEQALFDVLVADIKQHRERVVETISGTTPSQSSSGTTPSGETNPPESVGSDGTPHTHDAMAPHEQSSEPPTQSQPETPRSEESMAADAMGGGEFTDETPTPPQPSEFASEDARQPPADDAVGDVAVSNESSHESANTASEAPTSGTPPHLGSEAGNPAPAEANDQPESVPEQEPSGRIGDGGVSRERVLVTDDVETFLGFDERDYDLSADDVVTLPSPNAEILVNRDAARRL